uniref:Uncharacterized protein n=1 Tax=Utricularia reniformis TaxID=192314 RepID=A0A1Y0B019_9LAMI|nr:hypothetical protein AEK19_MT0526 [Utricularia reniformis]ART30782.1 hypothetical protein AEK19_MT0526 [Utricularia reniformis]
MTQFPFLLAAVNPSYLPSLLSLIQSLHWLVFDHPFALGQGSLPGNPIPERDRIILFF